LGNDIQLASTPKTRFWLALGSTALAQIVAMANAIFLVPLFLQAWGADGYGQWLALTALVAYLALLDLGGQAYIGNLLARTYVLGDMARFRRGLAEGVSVYLLITAVAFLVVIVMLALPEIRLPGQVEPIGLSERMILLFLSIATLLGVPGGVYVTVYRATGRMARGIMVGNIVRSINLAICIALLWLQITPLAYAGVLMVQAVVLTFIVIADIKRQIRASRNVDFGWHAAQDGWQHMRGSLGFWLIALATTLNFQGVILLLNARGSSDMVALYATTRTAAGMIGYVSMLLGTPLVAELTFLHAQHQRDRLTQITVLAVKGLLFVSGIAALGLWLILPVVYPLWTGRQLTLQPLLLAVLLVQGVLAAGWNTSSWILLATNEHRRITFWAVANAVTTVALAWLLIPKLGVLGAAIATLCGDIFCGLLVYPRKAAAMLGVGSWTFFKGMLQAGSSVTLLTLAISLATRLPGLSGVAAGSAVLGFLFYPMLRLVLSQQERRWLLTTFRRTRPATTG